MFKDFTKNYYANKNLHAYKYGYAESFEKHAMDLKLKSMILLAATAAFIGLCSGGFLWGIAAGALAATFVHNCFIDIFAAFVPNPLNDKSLANSPDLNMFFSIGQAVTPEPVQIAAARQAGIVAGKKSANDYNETFVDGDRTSIPVYI